MGYSRHQYAMMVPGVGTAPVYGGGGGGTIDPNAKYVATTGNNSTGDGSSGNPWLTPEYGASQLTSDGMTLYIRAGTYDVPTPAGQFGAAIYPRAVDCTIATYPGDAARSAILRGGIAGANFGVTRTGGVIGPGSYTGFTADNLTIVGQFYVSLDASAGNPTTLQNSYCYEGGDDEPGTLQGATVLINHAGVGLRSRNVRIYNNKFGNTKAASGSGSQSIMCYGVADILIEQNTFTTNYSGGLMFKDDTENCVVRYNWFNGNPNQAILLGNNPVSAYSKSGDIYQNVIQNCNSAGNPTFDQGGGIQLLINASLYNIYNNTFVANYRSGVNDNYNSIEYTLFNNIFFDSVGSHFEKYGSGATVGASYIDFNDYYNVSGTPTWKANGSTTSFATWQTNIRGATSAFGGNLTAAETGSLTTDPVFLNAGGSYALVTDFKRSTYTANGRGGSWPSVMGAYITGGEQIGANW